VRRQEIVACLGAGLLELDSPPRRRQVLRQAVEPPEAGESGTVSMSKARIASSLGPEDAVVR